MQRFNPFVVAITLSLLIVIAGLVHALKQHPPYAPEVKAQQHSNRAVEGEQDAKSETPSATISDKGHTTDHGEKAEEEGSEFWPPLSGYRLKITDSLLVAFTFGLTVFTGLLWKSTSGLFNVTKIVADADRPHMIPAEITISGIRGAAESGNVRVKFEYKFINYGRSPAFMQRFCLMIRVGLGKIGELEPIPSYGEPTQTNHIIVVNGWWGTVDISPSMVAIAEQDVADILNGSAKLIIVGFIEYGDTASQMHKMRFAYEVIFDDKSTTACSSGLTGQTPTGNTLRTIAAQAARRSTAFLLVHGIPRIAGIATAVSLVAFAP
jgi:hypothetical protein